MKKSPAERMMEMILKSLGETPESLAAKSPQEQAAIMAKVNQIMKQKMEEATAKQSGGGASVNISGLVLLRRAQHRIRGCSARPTKRGGGRRTPAAWPGSC